MKDVDLTKGRLNIMETKKHRSRIVMLADDVTEMLVDCNAAVSSVMPEREPFFPTSESGYYGKRGMEKTFRRVLSKANIAGTGQRAPRLYDFRHTFCTRLANTGMNPKALQYIMAGSKALSNEEMEWIFKLSMTSTIFSQWLSWPSTYFTQEEGKTHGCSGVGQLYHSLASQRFKPPKRTIISELSHPKIY